MNGIERMIEHYERLLTSPFYKKYTHLTEDIFKALFRLQKELDEKRNDL